MLEVGEFPPTVPDPIQKFDTDMVSFFRIQWCPDLVYPDLVDCRDLVDYMPATELGHIISPLFRFSGLFS